MQGVEEAQNSSHRQQELLEQEEAHASKPWQLYQPGVAHGQFSAQLTVLPEVPQLQGEEEARTFSHRQQELLQAEEVHASKPWQLQEPEVVYGPISVFAHCVLPMEVEEVGRAFQILRVSLSQLLTSAFHPSRKQNVEAAEAIVQAVEAVEASELVCCSVRAGPVPVA